MVTSGSLEIVKGGDCSVLLVCPAAGTKTAPYKDWEETIVDLSSTP